VLRRHCEARRFSGVSTLVFEGGVVVDDFCTGEADIEQRRTLRPDHIQRYIGFWNPFWFEWKAVAYVAARR
jgi:hypothetical protein